MWAAQHFHFEQPNHWMTSGGLGTMGYGLPAAMGVQVAHPDALVIDIAGEASVLMNIQEMGTLAQYRLPVKVFILNNQYMGMVRQWQELLHGGRYSESYSAALPDFVKLADSFHAVGLRAEHVEQLDDVIREMLAMRSCGDRRHRGGPEGELLPDDPERCGAQRDDPRPRARGRSRRHHRRRSGPGLSRSPLRVHRRRRFAAPIPVAVTNVDPAHARHHTAQCDDLGPGGQRAGHSGPRRRPVLRPRLQHRQPDRGAGGKRRASARASTS